MVEIKKKPKERREEGTMMYGNENSEGEGYKECKRWWPLNVNERTDGGKYVREGRVKDKRLA